MNVLIVQQPQKIPEPEAAIRLEFINIPEIVLWRAFAANESCDILQKFRGDTSGQIKDLAKLASIVCPTSVFGALSLCLPVSPVTNSYGEAGKQAQNKQHFCLPTCKMCLPNMKCLKKLVVAKRASKDRELKVSRVRQTMLVSFARP